MNWPKVLITGAGGFIGSHVAEELCRAGAARVRAGVARSTNRARIARLPLEIVHCDIMERQSLDAALVGIEAVVHCAHSRTDTDTTVKGTELLLDRAAANGVSRFVHMSSIAVYGNVLGVVTEDTPPLPPVNPYGQRKQAAELACQAVAGPQLAVAVLRPALVYGPYGTEWTTRYIKEILSGHLRQLGPAGQGNANLIHVVDLARFVAHLVVTELPDYSVFNANGSEIPTFNEYFERLSEALGRGPLPHSSNSFGMRAALRRPIRALGKHMLTNHQALLKTVNKSLLLNNLMKRAEANLRLGPNEHTGPYGMKVTFSALRAKEIGFEARISLEEGLATCIEWARIVGLTR
jgi:UDP-glucose 4-epimerase